MYGAKLTNEQYTQAVVELQARQTERMTAGQELKHARREFELRVHHLLGQDFPRMDALWSAHQAMRRYQAFLPFLGWRGRRILLANVYRRVLSEPELDAFLGD